MGDVGVTVRLLNAACGETSERLEDRSATGARQRASDRTMCVGTVYVEVAGQSGSCRSSEERSKVNFHRSSASLPSPGGVPPHENLQTNGQEARNTPTTLFLAASSL
ncbi:hypothetical protein EYF80_049191 [Liparis tanakae]|uniref:Uncharacterized protein n=1 Tax=Liparis tanakae TaxID=230148 RepID=A0A4Z2FK39_9TELE|nr:hypothetical protein EYF80_049191 [Liparis tanakae]